MHSVKIVNSKHAFEYDCTFKARKNNPTVKYLCTNGQTKHETTEIYTHVLFSSKKGLH